MSLVEEQSTYALFVAMAAPLMLGCDIRHLSPQTLAYLRNPELLAANQDPWGIQGSVVNLDNGAQVDDTLTLTLTSPHAILHPSSSPSPSPQPRTTARRSSPNH